MQITVNSKLIPALQASTPLPRYLAIAVSNARKISGNLQNARKICGGLAKYLATGIQPDSECARRGELASTCRPARPSRVLIIGSSPLRGRFDGFDDRTVTVNDGRAPCGVCFAVGGIGVIGRVDNRGGWGRRVAVCCSDIAGGTGREGEG